MLPRIERVILRKWNMLVVRNEARGAVPDLPTLILYIFERFKSHETVYRRESVKMW